MSLVMYINEDYLKKFTNLNGNIDTNIIKPNIIKAQDMYISSFLGKELDLLLKNKILTNSLSSLDIELMSLIKKAQVEFTCYLSYVDILFRWMNKSATTPSVENGTNVSRNDMIYVRDIAKNQGEFYLNEVGKFLYDNRDSYPQYKCESRGAFKFPFDYDSEVKVNLFSNRSGYNFN